MREGGMTNEEISDLYLVGLHKEPTPETWNDVEVRLAKEGN